jgi:nucleoside-diphosphate-sugar epimerase
LKVLLTGASGFVGSHILDRLRLQQFPTVILFRSTSNRRFLEKHLDWVEARSGSLNDVPSLQAALNGVTHVIHCAGATKAARISGFYDINQVGTRNLIDALPQSVRRLVHVSSLAAAGPSEPGKAVSEEDFPRPVSEYGKSKLAGEEEVRKHCRCEHIILRPPAVYGPRDEEFLRLFRAVRRHLQPRPSLQPLSMVFVVDLAEAIVRSLKAENAAGKTYYVSSPEVVTARDIAREIAAQMKVWTLPIPLPTMALWPICLAQELITRVTGKANVLSLQKYSELRAAAWVCDPLRLRNEMGYECSTNLKSGVERTLAWYRENRWL